jgi:hypothetical protein
MNRPCFVKGKRCVQNRLSHKEEGTLESADVKKLFEKIQLYEGELNNILSGVLITDREFLRPDFMTPKEDCETDRLILGSALL